MSANAFTNKTVFITGAGSGIGYQVAIVFAEQGADIIASDMNQAGLDALASEICKLGVKYQSVILNVTNEAAYRDFVESLEEQDTLPDVVVNNAGLGVIRSVSDTSLDDWRLTLDVNVLGVVLGCQLFSDLWKKLNLPGHLVNLSSMAAYTPVPNMSAYVASKYAVEGFSDVLNLELSETAISVTCVHPGIINTPIVHNNDNFSLPAAQIERLQHYYREHGVSPRSVAEDIVSGVKNKFNTVLTGKNTGVINFLKRMLPKKFFFKILLSEARKIGFLPL